MSLVTRAEEGKPGVHTYGPKRDLSVAGGPDSDKVEAEITVPMEFLRALIALAAFTACAALAALVAP